MKKQLPLAGALALTATLLILLSVPTGSLPALGPLFHPAKGFLANAETSGMTGAVTIQTGLTHQPVNIYYDERQVPHIFAQNDHDLYFAQGFVTARDRLFQMELQIRAASGMLSEWLGESQLDRDLYQRRIGMKYGAELKMEDLKADSVIHNAIQAYADGVNAYIRTLRYDTLPLEYKLLGVEPSEWKPINTVYLLKYMTQMLAGRNSDVRTSNTIAYMGEDFVNQFISKRPDLMEAVVPPSKTYDFASAIRLPETPDSLFLPSYLEEIDQWQPDQNNGSNNWVVSGSKTSGGYPILSNDMHLNMSLPSIWYEAQLHAPGVNVYGVTLQGTPTVIVGFNEQAAWGSTNTGAEVMDWFEITFKGEDKTHYLHDGTWKPTSQRIETIHIKGQEAVTDTLIFTHHGPVMPMTVQLDSNRTTTRYFALKWISNEPSNELKTFYNLNRASSVNDFRQAFRTYKAPAQNMNFASTSGDIAMQTGGRFPVKWPYQGRSVGDGSDSRYDWNGFIPYDHNPYDINPPRGFLSAANQYPAEPDYPYYLGEDFAPYERGRRINDLLRSMDNITVDDFRTMLMDSYSYHASQALPVMIGLLEASAPDSLWGAFSFGLMSGEGGMPNQDKASPQDSAQGGVQDYSQDDAQSKAQSNTQSDMQSNTMTPSQELYVQLLSKLKSWDYINSGDAIEPSLFHVWFDHLEEEIFSQIYRSDVPMRYPSRDIVVEMIQGDPASEWFDNPETDVRETLYLHIQKSYVSAVKMLSDEFGSDPSKWVWGDVNRTDLNHLAGITGLGKPNVFTDGGGESINAIRGSHGPSWRMIVELDPDEGVRAYGVYPGGQSGNPGSKTYDAFVEAWRTGELYELNFYRQEEEAKTSIGDSGASGGSGGWTLTLD